MSSAATELVRKVEANGGCFVVEGDYLVVYPSEVGEALVEELRKHKPEIIDLLLTRTASSEEAKIDEEWGLWLLEQCFYVDGWWGGASCLFLDLARWLAERGRPVPASRLAFVTALQAEGFQVSDGLVYGLILKEDWLAHPQFQRGRQ
jgi:hypothetical protein